MHLLEYQNDDKGRAVLEFCEGNIGSRRDGVP